MTTGYGQFRTANDRTRDRSQPLPSALNWSVFGGFIVAIGVAYIVLDLPWWIPTVYGALSIVTFAAYGIDKAAARGGRRRISEQTLLVVGLFGGWPGGLFAQQLLRHKTRKRSFRRAFWCTVVINLAALTGLITFATLNGVALELPLGTLSVGQF